MSRRAKAVAQSVPSLLFPAENPPPWTQIGRRFTVSPVELVEVELQVDQVALQVRRGAVLDVGGLGDRAEDDVAVAQRRVAGRPRGRCSRPAPARRPGSGRACAEVDPTRPPGRRSSGAGEPVEQHVSNAARPSARAPRVVRLDDQQGRRRRRPAACWRARPPGPPARARCRPAPGGGAARRRVLLVELAPARSAEHGRGVDERDLHRGSRRCAATPQPARRLSTGSSWRAAARAALRATSRPPGRARRRRGGLVLEVVIERALRDPGLVEDRLDQVAS